ncbi:hypothetical protein Hanom_Chr01g00007301 [Helianthus anomalus]
MEAHGFLHLGKRAKKIIHDLIIITCWCIWKERNEMAFQNVKCGPQDTLRVVKSRGFV